MIKVHPRFPDYEIHDDGRVFRVRCQKTTGSGNYPRFGEVYGRILESGYRQFKLCTADSSQAAIRANRLIAETFIGPAPSLSHQAAHNDGVRLNNTATNLRWATPKENADDQNLHGTRRRGELMPNAKLTNEQAQDIRQSFTGKRGEIAVLSRRYKTGRNVIYRVIEGETYHAPGQSALDKKQGAFA